MGRLENVPQTVVQLDETNFSDSIKILHFQQRIIREI